MLLLKVSLNLGFILENVEFLRRNWTGRSDVNTKIKRQKGIEKPGFLASVIAKLGSKRFITDEEQFYSFWTKLCNK